MTTLTYTVKPSEGFLAIARFIFENSPRAYIRTLTSNYRLVKEAADKIEAEIKSKYHINVLTAGMQIVVHADIGHYIPRLALVSKAATKQEQAKSNAGAKASKDNYFVIHSTQAILKDSDLEKRVSSKRKGAGHAYINKEGTIFKIWPYNDPNGYATKAEWSSNKPDLRGKLVHIELNYTNTDSPTEKQYQSLADIYLETKELFKKWLPIASHREIDRGLRGGHRDPLNFDFKHFYTILKGKGVPIDTIEKQSQERFNQEPLCEHKWEWPPILSGSKFRKVPTKELKEKGCKIYAK